MADPQLLDKIHSLGDLELAILLCLIAREHCLISTEFDSVDALAEELRLVASKTFNLSSAIVSCHAHTTLEEFATGLLVHPVRASPSSGNTRSVSPYRPRNEASQLSTGGAPSPGSHFGMSPSPRIGGHMTPLSPPAGGSTSSSSSQARIANVVLAKDLDRAPRAVQIQALELIRTRRIFTKGMQTAPKQFLFIALVGANSGGQARVTPHLNDFFYLSHWHDPAEDGFPYLDEEFKPNKPGRQGDDPDEAASTISSSSVVKINHPPSLGGTTGLGLPYLDPETTNWLTRNNSTRSSTSARSNTKNNLSTFPQQQQQEKQELQQQQQQQQQKHQQKQHQQQLQLSRSPLEPSSPLETPVITEHEISHLSELSRTAHTSISVTRYQANLVAFLRTHRAVGPGSGGVTPTATRHLARLAKSLAPLHGLDYVTPSLVALALRKVYLHRLGLVMAAGRPERERSTQWGSDVQTVKETLEDWTVEDVLEDVLESVKVPM
ncbi:hypothetical protein VTH82DRAFT_5012 [Thermothelomyces myriococcoides]